MPREHGRTIDRPGKFRFNGDARDMNAVTGKTEAFHVDFVILLRHEVPMERPCDPIGVKMEIGHGDAEFGLEPADADEIGKHASGHEMGADDRVGLELADEIDEGQGLGEVERDAAPVRDPGVVAGLIPPAEELRKLLGELFVESGIKLLVQHIGVVERIIDQHLLNVRAGAERLG